MHDFDYTSLISNPGTLGVNLSHLNSRVKNKVNGYQYKGSNSEFDLEGKVT